MQWSENRADLGSLCVEVEPAKLQRRSAIPVGEQAEVAEFFTKPEGNTWSRNRRMNSVSSSLMTLLRLLCRESRQRKQT